MTAEQPDYDSACLVCGTFVDGGTICSDCIAQSYHEHLMNDLADKNDDYDGEFYDYGDSPDLYD